MLTSTTGAPRQWTASDRLRAVTVLVPEHLCSEKVFDRRPHNRGHNETRPSRAHTNQHASIPERFGSQVISPRQESLRRSPCPLGAAHKTTSTLVLTLAHSSCDRHIKTFENHGKGHDDIKAAVVQDALDIGTTAGTAGSRRRRVDATMTLKPS